jgi:hypothetical protein
MEFKVTSRGNIYILTSTVVDFIEKCKDINLVFVPPQGGNEK